VFATTPAWPVTVSFDGVPSTPSMSALTLAVLAPELGPSSATPLRLTVTPLNEKFVELKEA
jgi:hypothetical protein